MVQQLLTQEVSENTGWRIAVQKPGLARAADCHAAPPEFGQTARVKEIMARLFEYKHRAKDQEQEASQATNADSMQQDAQEPNNIVQKQIPPNLGVHPNDPVDLQRNKHSNDVQFRRLVQIPSDLRQNRHCP